MLDLTVCRLGCFVYNKLRRVGKAQRAHHFNFGGHVALLLCPPYLALMLIDFVPDKEHSLDGFSSQAK